MKKVEIAGRNVVNATRQNWNQSIRSLERSRNNWKEKYQQLAEQLSLEKTAVINTGTQTDRSTGTDGSLILSKIRFDTAKSDRSGKVKKTTDTRWVYDITHRRKH